MLNEDYNEVLLDDIFELLQSPDFESPEVILLLGSSGAGKSSLVNTLHGVITGKYFTIAKQGGGETQSVTLDLLRYENCGVKQHSITDTNRRQKMSRLLSRLPHILDCAGLGDENSPEIREIIELLVGGYIRPGTCIDAVVQLQKKHGTGNLKDFFKPDPTWKVSKIVFLQGCIDAIPNNMIKCLNEVLREYDPVTLVRKYLCEILVLITKYDLVNESNELPGETKTLISNEKFLQKEEEIAKSFSSVGSTKRNLLHWINLTDNVEFNDSAVHTKALEFLKRMVEPGAPKMPAPTYREKLEDLLYQLYHKARRYFLQRLHKEDYSLGRLVISFVVVIVVIYWLLSRGI